MSEDIITRTDHRIIAKIFEPVAHFVQRHTGRTNFWVASLFAGLGIVFTILDASIDMGYMPWSDVPPGTITPIIFFGPLNITVMGLYAYFMNKEDIRTRSGTQNPSMISMVARSYRASVIRIMVLAATPLSLSVDLNRGADLMEMVSENGSFVCLLLTLYFAGCRPLPPGFKHEKEPTKGHLAHSVH